MTTTGSPAGTTSAANSANQSPEQTGASNAAGLLLSIRGNIPCRVFCAYKNMFHRYDILSGSRGLMCHYLPPNLYDAEGRQVTDLNTCVDSFEVDRFIQQVLQSGSRHIIFTIGQNTGCYCAPNAVIEEYAGSGHCSRRDLLGELMEAARAAGLVFIAYLPCEIRANTTMHKGFHWNTTPNTAQQEFQIRYLQMIEFWAKRYGKLLNGWWMDGCYTWDAFHSKYLKHEEWFRVLRSGNPDAVVAFNDGSLIHGNTAPVFPEQDYLSGECIQIQDGLPLFQGKTIPLPSPVCSQNPDTLNHILLPIDALWWHGAELPGTDERFSRFSPTKDLTQFEPLAWTDEELAATVRNFCGIGAAATFNVAVLADGTLNPAAIDQLTRISQNHDH